MHKTIVLALLIAFTTQAQDDQGDSEFIDLNKVPNSIETMKTEFSEKNNAKANEPSENLEVKSPEELEQIAIEKERERRIKQSEMDKDSDDFLLQDPNLNDRYQKGAYLVYDCIEEHWVCTAKEEYQRCESDRDNAIADGRSNLACANFRKYASVKKCKQSLNQQTNYNLSTRFCLGKAKQKETFRY